MLPLLEYAVKAMRACCGCRRKQPRPSQHECQEPRSPGRLDLLVFGCGQFSKLVSLLGTFFLISVPYYIDDIGDLRRDPSSENYPCTVHV